MALLSNSREGSCMHTSAQKGSFAWANQSVFNQSRKTMSRSDYVDVNKQNHKHLVKYLKIKHLEISNQLCLVCSQIQVKFSVMDNKKLYNLAATSLYHVGISVY